MIVFFFLRKHKFLEIHFFFFCEILRKNKKFKFFHLEIEILIQFLQNDIINLIKENEWGFIILFFSNYIIFISLYF